MTDVYGENVVLLMHGEGANNGTVYTDSSIYGHAISNNGASLPVPYTQTSVFKYGASALFTPATSNPMGLFSPSPAPSAEWDVSDTNRDFTVEMWFQQVAWDGSKSPMLFQLGSSTFVQQINMFLSNGGGYNYLRAYGGNNGSVYDSFGGTPTHITNGQWYFATLMRASNVYYLFLDGVLQKTMTPFGSLVTPNTYIAVASSDTTLNIDQIYVDEVRFTNGVARYPITGFTPPTAAFDDPVCTIGDAFYNSVSTSLHFEGNFTDSGPAPLTYTATNCDTAGTPRFGTGAWHNTGNQFNAHLTTPVAVSGPLDFQSGPSFTLEFWYYHTSADAGNAFANTLVDISNSGVTGFFVIANQSHNITVQVFSAAVGGPVNVASTFVMATNTWTHVAVVLDSVAHTWTLYVNGVGTQVTSITAGWTNAFGGLMYLGGAYNQGVNGTGSRGYIDNFRVTKGVARYTADFLPSPCSFSDSTPGVFGGTVYGKFLDAARVFPPIQSANLGNAKPRVFQPFDNETIKVP